MSDTMQTAFLSMQHKVGFYPIVDDYHWLPKLATWGVKTVQLRLKGLPDTVIEKQIKTSIQLAEQFSLSLFINDYWQLAIKHGAYGVHLGQENLHHANLAAIKSAQLRLGISTHDFDELKRALDIQPSYIALGPIYPTTSKVMKFPAQGLNNLHLWRDTIMKQQLVAIGGIKYQQMKDIMATGVDGISVISYVTQAKNPELNVRQAVTLINQALSNEVN